ATEAAGRQTTELQQLVDQQGERMTLAADAASQRFRTHIDGHETKLDELVQLAGKKADDLASAVRGHGSILENAAGRGADKFAELLRQQAGKLDAHLDEVDQRHAKLSVAIDKQSERIGGILDKAGERLAAQVTAQESKLDELDKAAA